MQRTATAPSLFVSQGRGGGCGWLKGLYRFSDVQLESLAWRGRGSAVSPPAHAQVTQGTQLRAGNFTANPDILRLATIINSYLITTVTGTNIAMVGI